MGLRVILMEKADVATKKKQKIWGQQKFFISSRL